jgi:DNA-binding beta-propeller fold protein YncE
MTGNPCIVSFIVLSVFLVTPAAGVQAQEASLPLCPAKHLSTITSDFQNPSDVVAGKNNKVYVLDGVNNKVKVFDQQGAALFSFGGAGTGKGFFNFPLGMGIDSSDRIYLADSGNHRVQVFTPGGKYLFQFSTETQHKQIKPSDPTDVVVESTSNKCFVVDNDNHWIFTYDLGTRKFSGVYGAMGMEKNEFRFPFFLDMDQEGNLYVVEVINTRVQVLNTQGAYITTIGGWGVEKGEFYRPKGVAVDGKNRVFVSDSYLEVIQVFDRDGTFLSVLGNEEGSILKFVTPTGIFIDQQMRLYVVEMQANRVEVLQLQN